MKLRRNHQSRNSSLSFIRLLLFAVLTAAILFALYQYMQEVPENRVGGYELVLSDPGDSVFYFSPSARGELVIHTFYQLSYREDHEQAEWVAYELTDEQLRLPNVPRARRFLKDEKVSTESTDYYDYKGSGYTRGHLAPAGDMAFSELAMQESFFLSNISPQIRVFNNGVWKELEEQTRDWVYHNKRLFIVTGPVLSDSLDKIKRSGISVPNYFYKVLLDLDGRERKGIAFLIPHERCDQPLQSFALTIDSLETITGIDFFYKMTDPELAEIEANIDLSKWKFSEARYKLRVERWNNEQ